MKQRLFTFAAVGFFVCATFANAEMTSGNFRIRWDTVSTGGSDTSLSASYLLHDTGESAVAGSASSASYQLSQGYRAGVDDQIITFEVFAEDTASGRTATALAGTTVTADPTGLSVGDMIAVVQNVGVSQVAAIGRIASFGAGTIAVDVWKDAGAAPVIDGINDVVYPMNATTVAFGELSTFIVGTGIVAFEVTAANDNGFVVQVLEDGNLRSGANDIDDVADGSVTVAVEEYGARSSDTTLVSSTFDTADTALTTSFQSVATESSASFENRNFITLKAAISSSTTSGSYAHTISVIASGNF